MLTPLVPLQGVTSRPEGAGIELRQNQTLAAQVLRVSTDNVVLAMQGVRVVARLTEAAQSAWLSQNQTALFQVQSINGQEIALRVLRAVTPAADESTALAAQTVTQLLEQAGLPPTAANVQLAHALLRQGQPVTAESVAVLQQALGGAGPWPPAQADLAAALRAAGVPLSAETLALAQNQPVAVLQTLPALRQALDQLISRPLPAPLAEAASQALDTLAQLHIDWSAPPERLAEQIATATRWLLRPVEHQLAQQLTGAAAEPAPEGLWALARLRTELLHNTAPGSQRVLAAVDQCLAAASLTQLANAAPPLAGEEARWLVVPMALHTGPPAARPDADPGAAHLRVAYQDAGDATGIDPGHTRLRLQIDLPEGQAILVDLAMAGQRLGAHVLVPEGTWQAAAEAELPDLAAGLRSAGYELRSTQVTTGSVSAASLLAVGVPAAAAGPAPALDVEA